MDVAEVRASDRGVRWPRALRYHAPMKKTPRRLVLHSETLRTLANMDLARAVGGVDSDAAPPAAYDSGRIACATFAVVVIATAACH